jgi:hypothetical protein
MYMAHTLTTKHQYAEDKCNCDVGVRVKSSVLILIFLSPYLPHFVDLINISPQKYRVNRIRLPWAILGNLLLYSTPSRLNTEISKSNPSTRLGWLSGLSVESKANHATSSCGPTKLSRIRYLTKPESFYV